MFSLLTSLMLAQTPAPQEYVRPQEVRSLPGSLDTVPVFNSNSPEKIGGEGILLSTFPPEGMTDPNAHLNFGFAGRFDVFAHHVYGAVDPEDLTSMYVGILVHNPGEVPIEIDVIEGASYLSQPDAPFTSLPSLVDTSDEEVFAGPGSRAMGDVLRGRQRTALSPTVTIAPGEDVMLLNAPIPVSELDPPLNGRSTILRLRSDDTVYMASLAMYAQRDTDGSERAPTVEEWRSLLESSSLSEPRDLAPTPLDAAGDFRYGRVSGVAIGSRWQTTVADTDDLQFLHIPAPEEAISYPISSLVRGQMGTEQVQTAAMAVRYPDTAYQAHGNYGIEYDVLLPLYNPTDITQQVVVRLETPIKEDTLSQEGLRFFDPLPTQTFFRGAIELQYRDDTGSRRTRYFHLVQQRGQEGDDLVQLAIAPQNRRPVRVRLLYPPDATPPQVLTIYTLRSLD
jgi:hypothetical protein